MLYLDTSLLVSLIVPEPRSRAVRDWLRAQTEPLCISLWSRAELAGVLGTKAREGGLSRRQAALVQQQFDESLLPFLREVAIDRATYIRCLLLLGNTRLGLRAPDALHLAACRGPEGIKLVTADRILYRAARSIDFPAALLT